MKSSRGFTLIELLVVISIISILASVVLVSLQSAKERGRLSSSTIFSVSMYRGWGADAFGVWNFDEASGGASDSGPKNINLTCTGTCNRSSTNRPISNGNSLDFQASNVSDTTNFLDSGTGLGLNFTNGYTTSVWLYLNDSASGGFPYAVYPLAAFMNFTAGGTPINIGPRTATYITGYQTTNYTTPIGKWVHFATSYDGTNNLRFYADGKLIFSQSVGAATQGLTVSRITVGDQGTNAQHFRGLIDEFSIYNNVLTADAIQQIYARGASRHYAAPNNSNNLANTISSQNASSSRH